MAKIGKAAQVEYMGYQSIVNLKDYFLAKAGGLQFFNENSFWDYVQKVRSFVKAMGYTNPEEVVEIMKADEDRGLGILRDYVKILRDRGCSPRYQITCFSMLKTWLVRSDVDLKWKKVVIPKARGVVNDRAPTKLELRKILSYGRPWMVPGTLIMTCSGMRVGTLLKLKLKHVDLEAYDDLAIVEVPPEANKGGAVGYFTAINLEAKKALEQYLEYRRNPKKRRIGEKTVTIPGEVLTPESPLIVGPISGGHMKYAVYRTSWTNSLELSGLNERTATRIVDGEEKGGVYVLHVHTLRKYFRSSVEGILTKSIREAVMGHMTVEYLDQSYLRIPEKKLVSEYRKAAGALTVFEDMQSEDFERRALLRQASIVLSPEKFEMLKNIMATERNLDKVVIEYHRMTLQPNKPNNGNHKIIQGEDELLRLLDEGYKLVEKINEDKYLVRQN